jgi:hypothetical protein
MADSTPATFKLVGHLFICIRRLWWNELAELTPETHVKIERMAGASSSPPLSCLLILFREARYYRSLLPRRERTRVSQEL